MAKQRGNSGNGDARPKKPPIDPGISPLVRAVRGNSVGDLYHNTYLSRSTIANLVKGKTRRPNHMTMTGIAAAAGLQYKLVRKGD